MGNRVQLDPLEPEVQLVQWACQDLKAQLEMQVKLGRLEALDLQVKGD